MEENNKLNRETELNEEKIPNGFEAETDKHKVINGSADAEEKVFEPIVESFAPDAEQSEEVKKASKETDLNKTPEQVKDSENDKSEEEKAVSSDLEEENKKAASEENKTFNENKTEFKNPYTNVPYGGNGNFINPYITKHFSPELYFEKAAVRKTAGHICWPFVIFSLVSLVLQEILSVVLYITKTTYILKDSFFLLLINLVITLIIFIGMTLSISGFERKKPKDIIPFGPPKKKTLVPVVMIGLGVCFLGNIMVAILQNNLSWLIKFKGANYTLPSGPLGIIMSVISVAAVPALIEELLFRGAVMGSLRKFSDGFAIFVSAAIFGLFHGNLVQIPFAFIVGLALGFAVAETGSLWPGIIIHFLNNLISVILEYVTKYFGNGIGSTIYIILTGIMLIIGFFGIYLLSTEKKDMLKYKKTGHISMVSQRVSWFASAPASIVFLIFIAIKILINQFLG